MSFEDLWNCATGGAEQSPFPYQVRLATTPWPDIVKIPTGLGKTAGVALAWMYKRLHQDPHTPRRLVWCLPMRTLVEQTAENVGVWLDRIRSSGHDSNGQLPCRPHVLMGGEIDDDWLRHPEKPAILVGTQDILLSRALMRGYGVSRGRRPVDFALLHNDAMWVFDEVQLMAAGAPTSAQIEAFRQAIGTMIGCRSLWMSATVERGWLQTVDFDASQLVVLELDDSDRANGAVADRLSAKKTLSAAKSVLSSVAHTQYINSLADEILHHHRPATTTLVVLNRVSRAQELYSALTGRRAAPPVLLVHGRFRPAEREVLNQRLLDDPDDRGRIVVSTQAVEAGVDITSAVMFTELAPWPSLVQRFGRLNRRGEESAAAAYWIDIEVDGPGSIDLALPYAVEDLVASRERLSRLDDVSPETLERLPLKCKAAWQVVRRKDLYDLFDTDPDLTGFDVDVSPYVRGADDSDVRVFWRRLAAPEKGPQGPEAWLPHRDEICPIPIGQARKWLETADNRSHAFVWDWVDKGWVLLDRLWPGAVVLVDAAIGGYDEEQGFLPTSTATVPAVECEEAPKVLPDRYGDDHDTPKDCEVRLRDHLLHVRDEAIRLCCRLGLPGTEADAVATASLWHDLGKAHDVFKARCGLAPEAEPLAKTPRYNSGLKNQRNRRYFRHELASALAWLRCGVHDAHDLVAFLIAAHHGKVRMGLRALPDEKGPGAPTARFARGVWDGDRLAAFSVDGLAIPETELNLDVMELGGGSTGRSWATRTRSLLERYGPFRLAFLEALVRIADWRASRDEQRDCARRDGDDD